MSDEDREWDKFVAEARERAIQPIADSAFVCSLLPDSEPDVKVCLEIGAAVMLDKPIIAIAMPGRPVPENMRRLAHTILYADPDTEEGRDAIETGLKRFMAKHGAHE